MSGKDDKNEFIYTPSQEQAINAVDGDILVSAAAGSGKTMVLTHRIMKNLCRPEDPELLGDLLVVTFTKAAAAELVEKIAKLIREMIRKTDDDGIRDRLRRELLCLPNAQISTIHSYCLELIRENYRILGLPASFGTAEDKETDFLLLEVCKNVVDSFYEEERKSGNHDFSDFCAVFYPTRDDNIEPDLAKRYQKLLNYAEGIGYLNESVLMSKSEEAVIAYCRETILSKFDRIVSHYEKVIADALVYVRDDSAMFNARGNTLIATLELLKKCKDARKSGWDAVRDSLSDPDFGQSGRIKKELRTPEFDYFDQKRKKCQDELAKFAETYFDKIGGDPVKDVRKTQKLVGTLFTVLSRIDREFTEEKHRRALIDFSDMERMTLTLLRNDDIRLAQQKRFKRIYIDEYQDVNPLQDKIFSAISNGNRFMVGDIKQSIYGFRGAAPDLFARYRRDFPEHADGVSQDKAKIFLSDNFRCDKSVVDFSNALFGQLFPSGSGIVPYEPESDALVYSKDPEKDRRYPVEMHLFEQENAEDGLQKQAGYTAERIGELLLQGVAPGQIAILLQTPAKSAKFFADALKERGIPSSGGDQTAFFDKPHVLLTLSMLRVIDNPRRDIPLAAALKSPVFGIDADTLLKISACAGKTLYEKTLRFQSAANDPRIAHFLDWLSGMRSMQKSAGSHTLIRTLYEETDLYACAAAGGASETDLSAFDLLYDTARQFEMQSFRGLHAFLRYVDLLIESEENIGARDDAGDVLNAVHIISIHHSKGLEYPVCFIGNLEKLPNTSDLSADIIDDEQFGPALRLRDETGLVKYDTLPRLSQALRHEERLADEKARLLYVALTRARERLILLGSCKNPEDAVKTGKLGGAYFDPYSSLNCKNFLQWILCCPQALAGCELTIHDGGVSAAEDTAATENEPPIGLREEVKEKARQIAERVGLTEKRLAALSEKNHLPTKLSVSTLKPDLFDGSEGQIREVSENADETPAIPRFLGGKESATAAQKGTATHLFMQFCDFERVEKYGVAAEIAALLSENFIEKESAGLIEKKRLEGFFASDLFRQMRNAGKLWREERFNVLLNAQDFAADPDAKATLSGKKILVQGVADCFFIDQTGGVCLVDYKTDHFGSNLSEAEIRSELVRRYETQLSYYARAIGEILGLPVNRAVLWSFALNDTVEVCV